MSSDAEAAEIASGSPDPAYKYDAFISYSFATDYARARKLESFLEAFHKSTASGPAPVHSLQICRDGSDFKLHRAQRELLASDSTNGTEQAAKDHVWEIILRELCRAKYLIVLCSPGAVQSTYVPKEVSWFIKNRGVEWVLPVVTEAQDPKNQPEQCFPKVLIDEGIHDSRIWYDLRGAERAPGARAVRDHDDERVRLTSDLLEWDADQYGALSAVWQREQLKRRRRQASVAIVVALLVVALAGFGYVKAKTAESAAAEAESAAKSRDAALSEKQQALGREQQALTKAQMEQSAREVATKEREEAVVAKEEEAKLKVAAIEREKKAAEKARQEGIKAAHYNIDLALLNDKPDQQIPYDFVRREKLTGILELARSTGYSEAQATLSKRVGCLPEPSVRKQLLPADNALEKVLINHEGTRLGLVFKDRLEIRDAETFRLLHAPTPLSVPATKEPFIFIDPYANRIFLRLSPLRPDVETPITRDRYFVELEDSDFYVTTFDGEPFTRLNVTPQVIADIVIGFGLRWRMASFDKAVASMTDEQGIILPPSKLLEHIRTKLALTNLSRPILLEYDRRVKTTVYEVLTFSEQPAGDAEAVPATRRVIVEDANSNIVELVKAEAINLRVNAGPSLDIREQVLERGARSTVPTYLDGKTQIVLVGQRYFRFSEDVKMYNLRDPSSGQDRRPKTAYRFDFTPDPNFVLLRRGDSHNLFDITRSQVMHTFLGSGGLLRFTASREPQLLVADEKEGLVAWNLSTFGPNGWPTSNCPLEEKEPDEQVDP